MRNADYWRQRAQINSDAAHADANEYIAGLEEIYRDAVMSVKADLDRWFGRFADNNGITLAEARKWLTDGELEEFHWSVDKYIRIAEQRGLDPVWVKKLENASARYHVSRLEAIQMQIQQQAELVYGNQTDGLDELLRRVADNGYSHAAFDAMKGLGMGWDFTKLDQKRLDSLLTKPWTSDGKTFTDRCWEGKADLIDGIQKELTQSLLRGDSLAKTRDNIAQRFEVSKYKAGRLAHTEATYFNAVSSNECYKDLGVDQIEILETLDKHTCELCASMDGKVIDQKDYQPGVTVPPFHPNCRGTTMPWFDDMDDVGQRIARDPDGEVYYVPPDMTYKEWEKTFHGEGLESDLPDAVRRGAKTIISGKKVIAFDDLPDIMKEDFRDGLRGATPEARKALRQIYRKTDYVLGNEDRSFYRDGLFGGVVTLGKKVDASTVAHELFHKLDRGGKVSGPMLKALEDDYAALMKRSGGDVHGYVERLFPNVMSYSKTTGIVRFKSEYRGISDILNGVSNDKLNFGFKHSRAYWSAEGRKASEAWAQYGRIQYDNNPETQALLRTLFPSFSEDADRALKELI